MPQDKKKITPILILSDAPTACTGLARITNDIATGIATHMSDVCRVATLGYGGISSKSLPYHHYPAEGLRDFIPPTLPDVWQDWAGDEEGIIFTIWDLRRMGWFATPDISIDLEPYPQLRQFMKTASFKKWGYFPIDATGPHNKLTYPLSIILGSYHRRLAYGRWAAGIIDRTLSLPENTTDFLPHGIHSKDFYPRDRFAARGWFAELTLASFLIPSVKLSPRITKNDTLIGIVATNQSRKDWALALETVAILSKSHQIRLWIHTDKLEWEWSIPSLLVDFGLLDKTQISTGYIPDDKLAQAYSACDVTLGIGLGEGFGYPIFESIFCGTPCIHGNYGGAPEWMTGNMNTTPVLDDAFLVEPAMYRYEGMYSAVRPVFRAQDWADKVESVLGKRCNRNGSIDWENLWRYWEHWLRAGLE